MSFSKTLKTLAAATLAAAVLSTTPALAGSVENLERERAMMLENLLQADLSQEERLDKMTAFKRRLVDLERIALRDDDLTGRNTPEVRTLFQNYDLSFLIHSSGEKQMLVIDSWFAAMGLTTQSVMSAKVGRL